MRAQQHDAIELLDLGDAIIETMQFYPSSYYPDFYFGLGPYPGWLEGADDRSEDLPPH